jgi:bacterioferritin
MVFGYNRIPIVSWLRSQADECLAHANAAGEMITHFGEHPSLSIGPLLETHKHDIGDILRESLATESAAKTLYEGLLELVANRSIFVEEYARDMIAKEEAHLGTVDKMLRRPGDIATFQS